MGRPRDGKQVRDRTVHVRITPAGLQVLDRLRGAQSRSQYVRGLVAADARRNERR